MKLKELLKRYKLSIFMLAILVFMNIFLPEKGREANNITISNFGEMLSVVPPIFLLLGLLDVWVPREKMIKYMGEGSGLVGILLAFGLGTAAAGPLYAAFPIAATLLKKGANISNVLIFVGTWSTAKIPLLLFEASSLGWKFTITRLIINIFGIVLIAYITKRFLSSNDEEEIYELSKQS